MYIRTFCTFSSLFATSFQNVVEKKLSQMILDKKLHGKSAV